MTRYLPQFVRDFLLERRRRKASRKSIDLAADKRYAEAAEVYSDLAERYYKDRTLHFSMFSEYAMDHWIEDGNASKAISEARKALASFCKNDGEWFTYSSGDHAGVLIQMASKLHEAGFAREAESFAMEVNQQFEKYNLPLRCLLDPTKRRQFPSVCGQCGGSLPYSTHQEAVECSFCETLVYGQ